MQVTLQELAAALGGEISGGQVLAPGPGHSRGDRSLAVKPVDDDDGFILHSHAGDDPIACKDYVRQKLGLPEWKPNGKHVETVPAKSSRGEPDHIYEYPFADGAPCGRVLRWDAMGGERKKFTQFRWEGGEWRPGGIPKPRPLYRLPELLASPSRQVLVFEGEKCVDAARSVLTIPCVTMAGGANAVSQSDWSPLAGRDVIVWPDNDKAGVDSLRPFAAAISAVGPKSLRYVTLPGDAKPAKWDIADAILVEGWGREEVMAWAKERVRPFEPDTAEPPPTKPVIGASPEYSDDAIALDFAERHVDDARYVDQWGRWLIWDGSRWKDDLTRKGLDEARTLCREMAIAYALTARSPSGPKSVASARTASAVLSLASADRRMAATTDQWNADDWLLNTPKGTLDLRTMEMRTHRPADHMTKVTAVSPSGGQCPRWLDHLKTVFDGDETLISYTRRVMGYCLTGITREHAMFFAHGAGGNGKSVLLNTVSRIMGDYHITSPIETFTVGKTERHLTELARLHGARLVTSIETEEGRHWAESRIKSLTGGDPVSARFMRQDFFEFQPKFKLLIAGNHKPALRSVDESIRRRFNLIPFNVRISGDRKILGYEDRLVEEWPAILEWMMEGCVEWQESGLSPPDAVIDATAAYLEGEDAVAAWLAECCQPDANGFETEHDLFASWFHWAEKAGERQGKRRELMDKLDSRGYARRRTSAARGVDGLRLKPTPDWRRDD